MKKNSRRDDFFVRYGSPRQNPEEPFRIEPKETPEEIIIVRYGCPRPENSKKPSKLKKGLLKKRKIRNV